MLVRRPLDGPEVAIHQEQHALVSGILAAAWRPALHPRLIAAITLHDAPWRAIDAGFRRHANGGIIDFVSYPIEERLAFYAEGIDELELVDPYIAHMVSLHYSSFAGMSKMTEFREAEAQRRSRIEPLLGALSNHVADHLKWLQYFDVFSLHLCLTGPDVPSDHLPIWLRDTERWSTAPDGRALQLAWSDARTLRVSPFPFDHRMDLALTIWRDGEREAIELAIEP